ncbi:Uncharacterized protein GNX_3316 [Leptospira interrogans serovar Canicola]|nr:Uncharacterized protein GNX_3316 [Leptospira interrogans serovar Canicola]
MLKNLPILWILVRRDYALQFAGSALGISWMLVQNLSLILIYTIVFLFIHLKGNPESASDFIGYTFSGLLFWIPLQEYIIRGTSILTENRQLIKRSPLGPEIFLWIPYIQMLIHFTVTAVPVLVVLGILGKLNLVLFPISIFIMFVVGYLLSFIQGYLARANVILRDITPLIRLISQFFFLVLTDFVCIFRFFIFDQHLESSQFSVGAFSILFVKRLDSSFSLERIYSFLDCISFDWSFKSF